MHRLEILIQIILCSISSSYVFPFALPYLSKDFLDIIKCLTGTKLPLFIPDCETQLVASFQFTPVFTTFYDANISIDALQFRPPLEGHSIMWISKVNLLTLIYVTLSQAFVLTHQNKLQVFTFIWTLYLLFNLILQCVYILTGELFEATSCGNGWRSSVRVMIRW